MMDNSLKLLLAPLTTMLSGPFGFTVSVLIGFMGIGISLADLPQGLQIVFAVLGLIILVLTVLVKLETYLEKRSDRVVEDRAEKLFERLEKQAAEDHEVSDEVINDIAKQIEE